MIVCSCFGLNEYQIKIGNELAGTACGSCLPTILSITEDNKMIIDNKYNIGDHVFFVRNNPCISTEKCKACTGRKELELADNKTYMCPACLGNGWVTKTYRGWKAIGGKIEGINIFLDSNSTRICYAIVQENNDRFSYHEENLFDSLDEANNFGERTYGKDSNILR